MRRAGGVGWLVGVVQEPGPHLVRDAFRDPSGRTNPRMPMLAELADLFACAA